MIFRLIVLVLKIHVNQIRAKMEVRALLSSIQQMVSFQRVTVQSDGMEILAQKVRKTSVKEFLSDLLYVVSLLKCLFLFVCLLVC